MTSERTPLFSVASDAQDNSRSKKVLLAVAAVAAIATVGYVSQSGASSAAPIAADVSSMDVEMPLSTSTPGNCKSTKDCVKFGEDYSCVAVQSSIKDLSLLSQCVRGQVCTGNDNGACPSFSSWSSKYRVIQPVCAFAEVANCDNALDAQGESIVAANKSKTVTCFAASFKNKKEKKDVNGIYKCVDQKLYADQKLGYLDFTSEQLKACAGNTTTDSNGVTRTATLCNGHGTCAPKEVFSSTYGCKCSAGYSADDNCFTAVGNVCDGFGQCGAMGQCDPKTGACVCKTGAKGNQCSQCDPLAPADAVCSGGKGACGIDGVCLCNQGFSGSNCEFSVKLNNTEEIVAPKPSGASTIALSSLAAAAMVVVSLML